MILKLTIMGITKRSFGFPFICAPFLPCGAPLPRLLRRLQADQLDMPEAIIGVSLVAFGTSLPELVVGILSAIRRKVDFALGNVLGSNIYNVLGVLGVSSFFGNFNIPSIIGSEDLLFMLFVTLTILGFMFFLKRIGRTYGAVGLVLYIGYIYYVLK